MTKKPTYEELEKRIHELEHVESDFKKSQQALQESKDRFHLLYERAPLAYQSLDEKGNFIEVNKAWLEVLGYSREEVIGNSFSDFLHPDWRDHFKKNFPRFKSVGEVLGVEFEVVKKDGSLILVSFHGKIGKNMNGKFHQTHCIFQDITDRKKYETAVLESEHKLATHLKNTPIGALAWNLDFKAIEWNPAAQNIFGYSKEEAIGKHATELILPEDMKELVDGLFRDILSEKGGAHSINENITKDGRRIICDWYNTVLKDTNGKAIGIASLVQDITERKKTEDALIQNEQRYKSAQRIGLVGNWEYDLTSETFWASEQGKAIYGFDSESYRFTTEDVEKCIPERQRVHQALVDLIEKNKPYNLEFEIKPISGPKTKTIRSLAEVIRDDQGTPLKVIGVIQDITSQKESEREKLLLEKKLLQAHKMESIGNLAGGIAHDFNNILSSIIGFTELALEEAPKGSSQRDDLEEVYIAGNRAKELVQQILAFARQSEEKTKPVRLSDVLTEVLKLLRPSTPANIDIKPTIESTAKVMANTSQLHQIIMNLCTNAIHSMQNSGGVLDINLRKHIPTSNSDLNNFKLATTQYIELNISDNGPGIDSAIIDNIFEPYFTTKEVGEGSGMGLAMVKGIVESYKGDIQVKSVPGERTSFVIILPVATARSSQTIDQIDQVASGTERILFVDDEPPIARMGSRMLESLGYKVTTRTSSFKALELFKEKSGSFDLVITDMTMPSMTGDVLLMEMRKIRHDIPVILCTGYSNKINDEGAKQIGIDAFAYKPFTKLVLAKTVRDVLDAS